MERDVGAHLLINPFVYLQYMMVYVHLSGVGIPYTNIFYGRVRKAHEFEFDVPERL